MLFLQMLESSKWINYLVAMCWSRPCTTISDSVMVVRITTSWPYKLTFMFSSLAKNCHLVTNKKVHGIDTKDFWWKKLTKLARFWGNFLWNCHIQTIGSSMLQKYSRILEISSLTCSQIWLLPLVNSYPCGNIPKLRGKSLGYNHL